MLTHLTAVIRHLGPPVLYMTESFESTNVLTRTASIHSSRHDPGCHLAESFQDVEVSRHCFSGGLLWDDVRRRWTRGGHQLEAILENDDILDKTFGFRQHQWDDILSAALMHYTPTLQPYQQSVTAHQYLSMHQHQMQIINKITLKNRQEVQVGDFVAVLSPHQNPQKFIGRIRSIWLSQDQSSPIISLEWGSMSSSCHQFYGMRALNIHNHIVNVYLDEVRCAINVQHNCYDSHCQTERASNISRFPIGQPNAPLATHKHKNNNQFIINSASLYNGQAHHDWANIQPQPVTPEMWSQSIHQGLIRWKENPK